MDRFNHGKISKTTKKTTPKASSSEQSLQMIPSVVSEKWATISSTMASLMFAWAIICQYSPYEVRNIIGKLKRRLRDHLDPYLTLSIHESTEDRMKRSEAYLFVEAYLSSIASKDAKRLRADMEKEGSDLVISMDDYEEVIDKFRGGKFWWSMRRIPVSQRAPYYEQGKRYYVLTFHRKYREVVTKYYLEHVMKQGKEARSRTRQRKLYTNIAGSSRMSNSMWSHVVFEHPARLENMALEPELKEDIFEDLVAFSKNKEFYERAGKAWKRGYLLYGPPGTGKSTMVAAMANLLNYDVYDIELTAVKDNTELRRLLIETTSKSIIVIEDIDCSLDLTGQRTKKKAENSSGEDDHQNNVEERKEIRKEPKDEGSSRVTLSGLLNFIDGIWSACGSERLIVFTTNYVDKLDPALI